MASISYKLIWEVLFLFVLLLSANHAATTNGKERRLAGVADKPHSADKPGKERRLQRADCPGSGNYCPHG
ncbi:hypothetical protein L6164_017597 [Bauhinia variegata]|uniref:Uncharacterized protein n=1 Tax=Bauhinia variegata TaxID=167791 RepID=A0ACB9N9Q1_BAUVA|nr:hypothetical protein L6164_017597 [Bauhinia variegata]